jgi:phenylpropionate dioxygenase-like ring-hydroxylating dioxygenase large terminal subunit
MVDVQSQPVQATVTTVGVRSNSQRQDRRELIPELGLKEYWYPAIEASKVKKKPLGLKILGEDLVFFQGKHEVAALWNVCPHRGGSLMHGDCHFEGTVSCPYHGWTYDENGNVLAVLPEGPESKIPGKVTARKYPTQTHRGMVFVWMGEGDPAPITEDVPPEFFTKKGIMFYATEIWPMNWRPANENAFDAHVPYVHRDALMMVMSPMQQMGEVGMYTDIKFNRAAQCSFPGLGTAAKPYKWDFSKELGAGAQWPKTRYRMAWNWAFEWANRRRWRKTKPNDFGEEWNGLQHHLPAIIHLDYRTHVYSRNNIAIDATTTRQIYYHWAKANNVLGKMYEWVHFNTFHRWAMYRNFSRQDFRATEPQRYDTPEYLSSTDSHLVVWRRLLAKARGMESAQGAKAVHTTKAEKASHRLQVEVGMTPEWDLEDEG